jgi:hypothetical protein
LQTYAEIETEIALLTYCIMKLSPFKSPRMNCRITIFSFLAAVCLVGCSSTSYKKGDAAANSLETAAAEVQSESRALDLTMGSLKDVYNDAGPGLQQPFQHFSDCLDKLVSAAHRTELTGQRMAQKNAAFLLAWQKQLAEIHYEHIRDLSQTRMLEVSNRFDTVNRRYLDSQAVVQPMIGYLLDVRHALNADLTKEGLASMNGVIQNAENNALKVQTALGALSTELAESGNRLSSVAYQPPSQPAQTNTAVSRQ